ncbi:MAG TPA: tRNA pseudouridine(55) synthase TruB [Egibacteraceae bacterium]|nr:tRNA pseudouridine(55) synthase TruB [Egibacteraceae bacterium]
MSSIHGVLVVDKPPAMTSHDVVAAVRRAVGGRSGPKVGHTGTLDPDATGVLVICLGKATRLVPYLQASAKTYAARMRLGQTTTTLDASGELVESRDASAIDEPQICEALKSFLGEIEQIPPMVSAVKVGGERLYAKARRGEEIERAARRVSIHELVLEDFEPGERAEAGFLVTCSPGTYVRTLAADIGERLGVGAHIIELRRLASGRFSLEQAVDLATIAELAAQGRLADAVLSPGEAVADYPSVVVSDADARQLSHGRPLSATGVDGPVAALDSQGTLLAMLEDRDGAARPLAVLSPPASPAKPADG